MTKRILLRLLGYVLCVLPPALATLERFPLFAREGGRPLLSGIALLLLLLTAVPLRRGLKKALARFLSSPSAHGIWAAVFIFTALFARIAADIADIALIGTLSSLLGALFFYLAERGVDTHEP